MRCELFHTDCQKLKTDRHTQVCWSEGLNPTSRTRYDLLGCLGVRHFFLFVDRVCS